MTFVQIYAFSRYFTPLDNAGKNYLNWQEILFFVKLVYKTC